MFGYRTTFVFVCRHLKRVHEHVYQKYIEHVRKPYDSQGHTQPTLTSFMKAPQQKVSTLRQRMITNSLVTNLIVKCGLPVAIVDDDSFRAFVADLDPDIAVPCRQTVTQTILPQLQTSVKQKLQQVIDGATDVSLTMDIWTDRRAHAFLAVTVHSFGDGQPTSHLLDFKAFTGSYTGVSETVIDDPSLWEDENGTEVLDTLDDKSQHLSCFAHTVQLVVRDGLASVSGSHRSIISKCCKLASLTHQSPLFKSTFESIMGTGK